MTTPHYYRPIIPMQDAPEMEVFDIIELHAEYALGASADQRSLACDLFRIGSAIKYVARAGRKTECPRSDLAKAAHSLAKVNDHAALSANMAYTSASWFRVTNDPLHPVLAAILAGNITTARRLLEKLP